MNEKLLKAYETIVEYLKSNTSNEQEIANFNGSPARCVKALKEMCLSEKEIEEALSEIIRKVFPLNKEESDKEYNAMKVKGDGMITQGPIVINSMCPHHLMLVRYEAYVSYVPDNGQVLGLSKLARISKLLGRRPVLQEQLASDIADVLCAPRDDEETPLASRFPAISSKGSAVTLIGVHTCESCRGVQENARTCTTEVRGVYCYDETEDKFQRAIQSLKTSKPF